VAAAVSRSINGEEAGRRPPPRHTGAALRDQAAQWSLPNKGLRRRLVTLDALCIASAWSIALSLGMQDDKISGGLIKLALETIALTAIGLFLMASLRLYQSRVTTNRSVTLERQALVSVALTGLVWGTERIGTPHPSIIPALTGGILLFVLTATTRPCFEAWVTLLRRRGLLNRPVLLIGSVPEVAELEDLLLGHPEIGYRPVGYLSDAPGSDERLEGTPWLGPVSRAAECARRAHAPGVVIAANGLSSPELNHLVRELHQAGVHVHLSSGLSRFHHRRVRQLPMAHEPFFYLEPPALRRTERALKRALDVIGAATVLVITSPILVIAAALIKISDRGPVMFRQIRIGQHGEQISIRKLRTMTVDAESKLDSLRSKNDRTGPLFKVENDPRVTRVGWWLRASSIDELPQLINVLQGSLSLVGPRPALPTEVAQFDEELLGRQTIRPGLTGLWQVEARHNSSFYAYRHLDLFYLDNWTLGLDLAILLATARSLVSDGMDALARSRLSRRVRAASRGPRRRHAANPIADPGVGAGSHNGAAAEIPAPTTPTMANARSTEP
jgi:exopolysaccharide biosynthesis polyprenyl glycosylphosphotransferase